MPEELTSRGILFICLLMGRSCTYLDVKTDIELLKNSIPVFHCSSSPFHCLYTPDPILISMK